MAKKIELWRVPLGCSARNSFAEQLEKLPFGEGVLVLPNRLLTDDVKRRYNVEVIGLDTLANKLLNSNGYVDFDEISRRSQELIVQDIIEYMMLDGQEEKEQSRLHELQQDKPLSYFDKLAYRPGFVKAMASLVSQLARSGATREEIIQALELWKDEENKDGVRREGLYGSKDEGVRNVYLLYRQLLENNHWYDLEGKYRLALQILQEKKRPELIWRKLYFSDYYSFDRLQVDFIRALAQYCEIKVGMVYEPVGKAGDGNERDKYFSATQSSYTWLLEGFRQNNNDDKQERVQIAVEERVLKKEELTKAALPADIEQLRYLGANPAPVAAENVKLYKFGSREAELRWVLADVKQLLRSGVAAQKVLVAVRDLNSYAGLRRLADEYGLPISLPQTSALAAQPLVELLQLLLDSVSDSHEGAEAYFALLSSELLPLLVAADIEGAAELRQKKYFKRRSAAQQAAHAALAEDELWSRLDEFISDMEQAKSQRAPLSSYTQQLAALLQALQLEQRLGLACKQGALPLDAVAACLRTRDALVRLLQQLERDYQRCGREHDKITLQDFRKLWQEALLQTEIVLKHGRQDGVLITSVINVPGLSFDHVYIMGLRDGEFPQAKNENWIYNDKERSELSAADVILPTTAQSYAEDACFFAQTVTAAQQRLVLSWTEEAEHDESVYVHAVQKLFTNLEAQSAPAQPCASPQEVERKGEAVDSGWLAQQIGSAAGRDAAQAADSAAQRELGRLTLAAAQADALRLAQPESVYNGVLADEALRQRVQQRVGSLFSPSRLELYAQCPFRYLGEYVWKQQQFAAKEDEVEPADEGSLLHEVMARFFAPRLGKSLCAEELAALRAELEQTFDAVCAEFVAQDRIVDNALWQAEQPRLLQLLQRWLAFEYADRAEWNGFTPAAVEWDFSSQNGKPYEMKLTSGKSVRLAGRIDRIDSDGESIFITDYKRSKAPAGADVQKGMDIQLPVYLLAAAAMYAGGKRAAGGCYFVLKDSERSSIQLFGSCGNAAMEKKYKSSRIEKLPWDSFKEFCENIIRNYIESIYAGAFPVNPKKCDAYCQLSGICRKQELNLVVQEEGSGSDE